jgi:hypothetical protein
MDGAAHQARSFAGIFRDLAERTAILAQAEASVWAGRLATEPANGESDPLVPADWQAAWDWAANLCYLKRIASSGRPFSGAAMDQLILLRTFGTFAAVTTVIAASLVAANWTAKATLSGFVIFIVASIALVAHKRAARGLLADLKLGFNGGLVQRLLVGEPLHTCFPLTIRQE